MNGKPVIIACEPLSATASRWLAERAHVVHAREEDPAFEHSCGQAVGLVVRTYTLVNDRLLSRLPRLRVVGRAGVGLDNIDTGACQARGVRVVSTPDANTQAVVEYVLALLCRDARPLHFMASAVAADEWAELRRTVVGARQLSELKLGVLGMGRIGKRVAQVGAAIGCAVAYNDLLEIPASQRHGAQPAEVRQLFSDCDALTIHVDGRESNRHLVSAGLLTLMKPDALLINTSRGMVVDASALAARLRACPQMRAVIDVHDPEPFNAAYPLLGLPNAALAPHLASRTNAAMEAMSWVVRDMWAALEQERG